MVVDGGAQNSLPPSLPPSFLSSSLPFLFPLPPSSLPSFLPGEGQDPFWKEGREFAQKGIITALQGEGSSFRDPPWGRGILVSRACLGVWVRGERQGARRWSG